MHLTNEEMIAGIDAAADAARVRIVGDPIRVFEYQTAESDAVTFKAAGYAGTCPASIAVWAQAKGWTNQQAADDILRASASWRQALIALRQARLTGKEGVRSSADHEAAEAAYAAAMGTIKYIQSLVTA